MSEDQPQQQQEVVTESSGSVIKLFGEWSFDKVEQYAHDMDSRMESLYKTSTLRSKPNHDLVSEKLIKIIQDYLVDQKEL